jgi:Ca2+:H+ antiporter
VPSLDAIRAAAVEQAASLESDFIGTEHLFLAWLSHARGPIIDAMSAAGLTAESFAVVLSKGSRKGRGGRGAPMGGQAGSLTSHAQRVVEQAIERAKDAGREDPSADDLVLAMIQEPRGAIARALTEFDVKPSRLKALAAGRPVGGRNNNASKPPAPPAETPGESTIAAVTTPPPPPQRERQPRREREPRPEREQQAEREPRPDRSAQRTPEPPPSPAPTLVPEESSGPPRRTPPLDVERGSGIRWTTPLYMAIPLAVWLYLSHAEPLWVFIAACIGVLPLAGLMGEATEQLAERTGPTLGGLLNATFGNAAELIIAIAALRAGLVDLVKASIAGSILGNLLLILGLALMAGGSRASMLRFNRTNAGMSSAMLALAVAGLVFPTLFHASAPEAAAAAAIELQMSEVVAGILIATYLGSLFFVLRTHRPLFGGGAMDGHDLTGTWSVPKAIGLLTVATIGVAVMSEILVHAVEPVSASFGVSQTFLGLILVPIIGNAAEHGTAVVAARRGHTDLALQIALGSSTQIALLVAPVLVFVGAFMAVPGMNLVFSPFEVIGLSIAVITSAIITLDGESHWFEGLQLLALYAMLATAAWFI